MEICVTISLSPRHPTKVLFYGRVLPLFSVFSLSDQHTTPSLNLRRTAVSDRRRLSAGRVREALVEVEDVARVAEVDAAHLVDRGLLWLAALVVLVVVRQEVRGREGLLVLLFVALQELGRRRAGRLLLRRWVPGQPKVVALGHAGS